MANGTSHGAVGGMLVQPGSVTLNGLVYRLAQDAKGAYLYRQRPAPFYPAQVSQGDMGEAQVSPDGRVPFSLRDLSGGGGLAQQPLTGDLERFDRSGDAEGEGCDASLTPGGPVVLSGRLAPPPVSGQAISGYLAGVHDEAGEDYAYLSIGRGFYRYDGVTLAYRGDLGAGTQASGAACFFTGSQPAEVVYQPLGYGTLPVYSTDLGNTFVAVGTAGGLGPTQSIIEVDGEAVVAMKSPRVGNAMVAVFDDGGPTPTLYGVIDPVGDVDVPISRLISFSGRTLAIKNGEGVYLLTDDRRSLEELLFPELSGARIYHLGATVWRGALWLPTSDGLYTISPGFGLQKLGPTETETSSLAPRAPDGPITAVAGDAHNLYAFRESPDTASWVYKANVKVSGGTVADIAWFPWSQQDTKARCRAMAVVRPSPQPVTDADAPGSHPPSLLYDRQLQPGTPANAGASVSYTVGGYRLPGLGRDPRTDPTYPYAPAGTLYYTRLLARFPAINKAWYSLTPLCSPLERTLDGYTATAAQGVQLRWKLDADLSDPAASPYGYTEGSLQRSGVGRRERFDPPRYGRGFDVALRLTTTDPTTSPQVYSVTAEYDLRPTPIWRHEMTLDLSSGAYSAGGASGYGDPLTPASALRALRSLAGASGGLNLVDLWGLLYDVSVPIDGVSLRASGGGEAGYAGEVPLLVDVVCMEQLARDQGTWRTVSLYRWRDIANLTWGQLPNLG